MCSRFQGLEHGLGRKTSKSKRVREGVWAHGKFLGPAAGGAAAAPGHEPAPE